MVAANDAVWLDVLPNMKGFGAAVTKGAGTEADKAGKKAGLGFGKAALAGVAVVGAGAALATKALYGIGETFDDVADTIRVGTGATGKDLDALVAVAKNVGKQVPADFAAIGTAVADINTRMGLTGDTLDLVARQYLEAGRMLGEEIDVMKTGAAFNAFKIEGEAVAGAMDHLFNVSQATGLGMNELAATVQAAAPTAQQLGLSFEETAGMVGTLDKAGMNSSKMMSGLSKALVTVAKDGEEPAEAFKRVVGEIEGFVNAGDKAGATNLAAKVFGTKNAPQFIGALESGALNLDSLSKVAGMTGDTILGASEDTKDFAEEWVIFKNKLMTMVEPAARKLFDTIGAGMTWINDEGVPMAKSLSKVLKENEDWLKSLGVSLGVVVAVWGTYRIAMGLWATATKIATGVQLAFNAVMAMNPIGIIVLAIAALVAGLVYFFTQTETGKKAWAAFTRGLKSAWDWVSKSLIASWNWIKSSLKAGWDWINTKVFDPMKRGVEAIGTVFGKTKDFISSAWTKIKNAAVKPVNFIIETVYTKGIKNVWEKIADKVGLKLKLPNISPIKFASGGVLPGYTPGRDVHHFASPTGGRLSLSGGEAIMRPEFTRAMGGPAGIARLNSQAVRGQLGSQAFAKGGVWDWAKNTAGSVARFVSNPIAGIKDLIGGPVKDLMKSMSSGFIGETLRQVPGKVIGGLGAWAKKKLFGREVEGGGSSPGGKGMGYAAMVKVLKGQFPGLRITSTYRPGAITATGNKSMHGMGRAVDMAPRMDVFNWLRRAYPNSTELIFSPAGRRQLHRGKSHMYGGVTRKMHYNHVHWGMANGGVLPRHMGARSYDSGGWLRPGQAGVNLSSKPEPVFNGQQWSMIKRATAPILAGNAGRGLGANGEPVRLSRSDLDYLADRFARDVLVGAKTVARGEVQSNNWRGRVAASSLPGVE